MVVGAIVNFMREVMDQSGSPLTIAGRFFGMGIAVLMLLGMASCGSNIGVDSNLADVTPAIGSPSLDWSPAPSENPSPIETPSDDTPVVVETPEAPAATLPDGCMDSWSISTQEQKDFLTGFLGADITGAQLGRYTAPDGSSVIYLILADGSIFKDDTTGLAWPLNESMFADKS